MALREIIEKHYRDFDEWNPGGQREILSSDVVTEVPGAGTIEGVEGFIQFLNAWHESFQNGSHEVRNVVEAGDIVIAEAVFRGTNTGPLLGPGGAIPATGRQVELKLMDLFKVREGNIVEHRIYFDRVEYMTQLGLMPAAQPA